MRRKMFSGLLLTGLVISSVSWGAVRPMLTRIVAYTHDRETAVEIINDSSETYMVQAWLEDLAGNDTNIPLVLTPPIIKLEGKKQGKLRLVVMKGDVPQDKESVYWLSLQEIPPKAKGVDNRLIIAIRSRLKVFVRSDGFNAEDARAAAKQLRWRVEQIDGKRWLQAENPTPYYISFGELAVGKAGNKGERLENKHLMVPPKGNQRYPLPEKMKNGSLTVTWSAMHDWGGAGDEMQVEVSL